MKILGGSAKGMNLLSLNDNSVRPALARMRNSLFNILAPIIPGTVCLDLFAGTGSLGLEALSRGADYCIFSENNRRCFEVLNNNIAKLRFDNRAQALFINAFDITEHLMADKPLDIIFVDPPYRYYNDNLIRQRLMGLLDSLIEKRLVIPDGRVIVEHPKKQLNVMELKMLSLYDTREYGQTVLSFFHTKA
ncbi:MAG: 16S rRNA (guanine(966)-N(2))-methyltransferase RsmD [Planctomycetota bacterium]